MQVKKVLVNLLGVAALLTVKGVVADEQTTATVAFPETYMLRVGSYFVDGSSTQFSLNSSTGGLGTTVDFKKDLGVGERETIPRIDAYYRFNDRHAIDFVAFSVKREGSRTIQVDPPIIIGDVEYSGETVYSSIEYTLYKLGYRYSFYRSPEVELSFTAGLNVTSYDLAFKNSAGDKAEAAGITVPLPVVGLRMGYTLTPKWSVGYVAEAFAIDIEDTFRGTLFNLELNTEYRLFKNFALGAGIARLGMNVEVSDDDWRGSVSDSYRGFTAFGTLYF